MKEPKEVCNIHKLRNYTGFNGDFMDRYAVLVTVSSFIFLTNRVKCIRSISLSFDEQVH